MGHLIGVIGKMKTDINKEYYIELEWTEELTRLSDLCKEVYHLLPDYTGNKPFTNDMEMDPHFREVMWDNSAVQSTEHWNKIKTSKFWKDPLWNDFKVLSKKFNLTGDILFFYTSKEHHNSFSPHRHPGWPGALMFPLYNCDMNSITSWRRWIDPYDREQVGMYNEYIGEEEIRPLTDEETAAEYCLMDKPCVFNIHQFHQIYNNKLDNLRVVAHMVHDANDWSEVVEYVNNY